MKANKPTNRLQEKWGTFTNSEGYFSTDYVEWLENKILNSEVQPVAPVNLREVLIKFLDARDHDSGLSYLGNADSVDEYLAIK